MYETNKKVVLRDDYPVLAGGGGGGGKGVCCPGPG